MYLDQSSAMSIPPEESCGKIPYALLRFPDFFGNLLKDQATRSGRLGQCLDPAVIKISISVKDHFLDSLFKALFSDDFSHFLRCLYIPWIAKTPFQLGAHGGGTDQGFPRRIRDGLSINMLQASKDIEARPFERSL